MPERGRRCSSFSMPRHKIQLSKAEQALYALRCNRATQHLAALSELVSELQFGLCKDCLQEFKLRAYPRVLDKPWTDLQLADVDGLCRECAKRRGKEMEIRTKGDTLVLRKKD